MPARLTIEQMKEVAASYGGKCLSKEYINSNTPLSWMCKKGHTWDKNYSLVQQGLWCPQCIKNETRLTRLMEMASEKGGKCLSDTYINIYTRYNFNCKEGHCFTLTFHSARKGNWCRRCSNNNRRKKYIEKIEAHARKKDGYCDTSGYKGKFTRLKWKCSEGHVWFGSSAGVVNNGYWCPECKRAKLCENKLQKLQELVKKRGGFCLSNTFTRTDRKLKWQCKEGHVFNMTPKTVKKGSWCKLCSRQIAAAKIRIPLERLRLLAKRRGGMLLSDKYKSSQENLKWQCDKGHIWSTTASAVLHYNHWCSICYREKQKQAIFARIKRTINKQGGRIVTKKYTNAKTKLMFECKYGHIWSTTTNSIRRGSWCPECDRNSRKKPIDDLFEIAKSRGGKLLSPKTEYGNSESKLRWKCKEGHLFITTPHIIRSGHWCRQCANENNRKKHI